MHWATALVCASMIAFNAITSIQTANNPMHEPNGQFALLKRRRFLPLFITQFLGALNDNLFKASLTLWIVFTLTETNTDLMVNVAAGLFILPFFLLSTSAGQVADKVDKAGLIRRIKIAEILIMLCGALAWWLGNVWFMFAVLLLLGAQSAFFGPSKYAILPQHVAEEDLIAGNALLEMGTFVAILLGTMFGGIIAGSAIPWVLAPVIVVIAAVGYLASRFIPEASPPAPDLTVNWNPFTQIVQSFNHTRRNHYAVLLSILGVSWFWLMGSIYVTQIPNYVAGHLYGGTGVVTLLLASFSAGIGLGALACDRLCGHKIEVGLVPFGALGLSVAAIHLTTLSVPAPESTYAIKDFIAAGGWRIILDLVLLSLFGAFFVVPLNAFVQHNAPEER
ncbi:MAG: MFS transporter, partial [Pseudomonadota bacterium]